MEWKPLIYKEYDLSDKYLVSEKGDIYSIHSGKILKQVLRKESGYYQINISAGSRKNKITIKTHIAVACAFLGGYKKGYVVNHKDGNKKNNDFRNLEWVSVRENNIHAIKTGLHPRAIRVMCINTGTIFQSISAANKWCGLNVRSSKITSYLYGKRRKKGAGEHPVTKELLQWKLV